jgi:hypothetical protein
MPFSFQTTAAVVAVKCDNVWKELFIADKYLPQTPHTHTHKHPFNA